MKYYKFLDENHCGPCTDFDYTPCLPKGKRPGKWLPCVDRLEKCESGYHACKPKQILEWLNAEMYEVEFREKARGRR